MVSMATKATLALIERVGLHMERDTPSSDTLESELANIIRDVDVTGKSSRNYREMRERYFTVAPEFAGNWRSNLIDFCTAFDMVFFESGDGESIVFLRTD